MAVEKDFEGSIAMNPEEAAEIREKIGEIEGNAPVEVEPD